MKLTVGNKIILIVGLLTALVLVIQSAVTINLVEGKLRQDYLNKSLVDLSARLDTVFQRTGQDLRVLSSHADFANYFTLAFFQDSEGASEAIGSLETFFTRLWEAKPQYSKVQMGHAGGKPILQINLGQRVESFDQFDAHGVQALVSRLEAAEGEDAMTPIHHRIREDEPVGLVLLSALPLVVSDRVEGLLWLYQPLEALIDQEFAQLTEQGISTLIIDREGRLVKGVDVPEDIQTGLITGDLSGWNTARKEFPRTGWTLVAGSKGGAETGVTGRLAVSGAISAVLLVLLVGLFVRKVVVAKLRKVGSNISALTRNSITERSGSTAKWADEIDDISVGFNIIANDLAHVVDSALKHTEELRSFSAEMTQVASGMATNASALNGITHTTAASAEEMRTKMGTVSAAAEQSSANMSRVTNAVARVNDNMAAVSKATDQAGKDIGTVAAASEQASTNMAAIKSAMEGASKNVSTIASSVEEMTASLNEVRKRCQKADQESDSATRQAQVSSEVMDKLSASANEIGKVVQVINAIADQTNMLALNAAIEAAGAGEAGKGFAVVANEVKELARQTAEATKMISEKIDEIRVNSGEANDASRGVRDTIERISSANAEINQAVDEQSSALNEIAASVGKTATESDEVARRVAEANEGIAEINRSINEVSGGISAVNHSMGEIAAGLDEVTRNVTETNQGNEEISRHVTEASGASQEIAQRTNEVQTSTEQIDRLSQTVGNSAGSIKKIGESMNEMLTRFRVVHAHAD